jgi:predicted esterase
MRLFLILSLVIPLQAGEDFTLAIEGCEDQVLVDLPANWREGGSYPAVLFYHGTGGRPSTGMIRGHAGEDEWIVVGMAYARRGTFQLTPAGMDAEVKVLRTVRDELEKRAGLDRGRVFVSGFSKGGWVSGLLLQRERWLAGAAILGAGHMHELEAVPKPFASAVPVFVGVGRHDRNYPFSLRARVFFGGLGAGVEMETWRGIGHDFPDYGSKGLREWLQLRRGVEPEKQELIRELEEIQALDGFEKWWALVDFRERPFVRAASMVEQVDSLRGELEKEPALAREANLLRESRRLLAREIGKKTLKDLEEIVLGYARIEEAARGSHQGEVATKDRQRVFEILEAARREQEALERDAPAPAERPDTNERSGFPRNPLVR